MKPLTTLFLACAFVVLSVLLISTFASAGHATGHSEKNGCARLVHTNSGTGSERAYKVSIEATPNAANACTDQSGYQIAAGSCWTLNGDLSVTGVGIVAADTVEVYILPDLAFSDHAASGTANWGTYWMKQTYTSATFDGSSFSFCATHNGAGGGTSISGTFRIAIRACEYISSGGGCPGSTTSYDVHSDPDTDGGLTGSGNSVSATQGSLVAGITPSCFQDGLTLGGANVDTYTGGDTRALRLCGQRSSSTYYETKIDLSIVSQAGAAIESQTINISGSADNADATWSTAMPIGIVYPDNTQPTKRAAITALSVLTGDPWTYFTAAPTGATLTSSTQLDAAWGLVMRGIDVGDPFWITASDVNVSEVANVSVKLAYDNGTARAGAASAISLHIRAPDGTWTTDAHPTELTIPGVGAFGFYYHTFTASQEGTYRVFPTILSEVGEKRNAPSLDIQSHPRQAQEAQIGYFGPGIYGAVNTTQTAAIVQSGTLQAGAATTATLATTASATDDLYLAMTLRITGGTGAGQSRVITDYDGSTKVATLDRAWATTPDATSTYAVLSQVTTPLTSGLEPYSAEQTAYLAGLVNSTAGDAKGAAQYHTNQNLNVTGTKAVQTDGITAASIATDAIGALEIAADAIGASEIAASAVGASEIATDAIGSAEIAGDAIGAGEIAQDAIGVIEFNAAGEICNTVTGDFSGTVAAATATTATLSNLVNTDDIFVGQVLRITGGTGAGQSRTIIDFDGTTDVATVDRAWVTNPTSSSTFMILSIPGTPLTPGLEPYTAGQTAYLSPLVNSSTSPLATTAHLGNANAYLAGLANSTTSPLATTVHLGNTNGYVAGLVNGTAAATWSHSSRGLTDESGFSLAAGSVTSSTFASGAIDAAAIATDALGASELASDAATEVATATWSAGTRTLTSSLDPSAGDIAAATWSYSSRGLTDESGFSLAAASVTSATFAAGAIDASAIATDAIGNAELAPDAIGSSELAADAVGPSELAASAVDADALATDASAEIWTSTTRTLTSSLDPTAADIWAHATRSLTDKAGFELSALHRTFEHAGTLQAAASGTATLASGAVSTDDFYNGAVLRIYGGTGTGQSRTIKDYVGSTRVATLDRAWTTTPDSTSTYAVLIDPGVPLEATLDAVATPATVWSATSRGLTDESGFSLADGSVTSATFAAGAITAGAIAPDAVGASELATDAASEVATAAWSAGTRTLTSSLDPTAGDIAAATWSYSSRGLTDESGFSLAAGSVISSTFAAGAIDAAAIAPDALGASELATDAASEIATSTWGSGTRSLTSLGTGVITSSTFSAGAIDAAALAPDAIGSSELAASAVTEVQTGLATTTHLGNTNSRLEGRLNDTEGILYGVWNDVGLANTELDNHLSNAEGTIEAPPVVIVPTAGANTYRVYVSVNFGRATAPFWDPDNNWITLNVHNPSGTAATGVTVSGSPAGKMTRSALGHYYADVTVASSASADTALAFVANFSSGAKPYVVRAEAVTLNPIATNSTASGALTSSEFNTIWTGEARPWRESDNTSARKSDVHPIAEGVKTGDQAILDAVSNASRQSMEGHAIAAWKYADSMEPRSFIGTAIALTLIGVGLVTRHRNTGARFGVYLTAGALLLAIAWGLVL